MTKPLLYFSYGMTKSGSTLAFQIVRHMFEASGFTQLLAPKESGRVGNKINAFDDIEQPQLDLLCAFAKANGPLVIKTHQRPSQAIQKLLKSGLAWAHATYRDPRDIVLSMLDHGHRARAKGEKPFAEIVDIDTALESVRFQTENLRQWLNMSNVLPIDYEELAFETKAVIHALSTQIGIAKLPPDLIARAQSEFTQKNKAIQNRHRSEMDANNSTKIVKEFSPFISKLITNKQTLPPYPKAALTEIDQLRIGA